MAKKTKKLKFISIYVLVAPEKKDVNSVYNKMDIAHRCFNQRERRNEEK